jgi:hypothetical protein
MKEAYKLNITNEITVAETFIWMTDPPHKYPYFDVVVGLV